MFKTIQMFFLLFSCLNMAFLLYLQRILMILWILNLFTTNFISYTMAKTKQIVECVPNFSEGRDMNIIRQITDAVESVKGVKLLDVDPGEATNRTVVTFVGEPDDVVEAAFRAVGKAGQLIDMRQHHGAHPRIGATDVLPIVPVSGITLEECAEISRKLAKRIADELNIPCYCYEAAAFTPERQNLAVCRKGEYEGIAERIDADAVLVRVTAVVLLVCTFGLIAVPYIAFAAFLPSSGGEGKPLNVSPLDVCSDRYHRVVEAGVARVEAKLWHPCRCGPYTSYAACVFGGFSSYAFSAYAKRGG